MNKYEQFIQQETKQLLKPDENIKAMGFLYNKSLLGMVMFGAISFMGNGYFFAVVTKYQLILIETEMGVSALKTVNNRTLQIYYDQIKSIKVGGFLNQKTIEISSKTGETIKFRLNTLARFVLGQKHFIKALQNLYQQSTNRNKVE
jgi:hypothetical protein